MKTIEEKAEDYAKCYGSLYDDEDIQHIADTDLKAAYIMGATEALQSQWRSVEYELPNDGEQCVIMDKDGRMRIGIYYAVNKNFEMNLGSTTYLYSVKTTKYWLPIPKHEAKGGEQ